MLFSLILTDNQCNDFIQLYGITLQNIRNVYQDLRPPITQTYSEPCVTVAYLKFGYIQNLYIFKTRDIFTTLGYSEPEAYSEACQTPTMERFEKQLTVIIFSQV